jgi:F-type H+-transporting ATPase subunit delta
VADDSTTDQRIAGYAEAMLVIAANEHQLDEVADELFRFARVLEGSDELRDALGDVHLPAARRQQIVEDLLSGKATDITVALISMLVGVGRARELPAIVDQLVASSAQRHQKSVAEVRSAIELTADQRARLATALTAATGQPVEVKVIVDPSIMGGVVAQIGNTVIDGSVRHQLSQLRETI